jgi:carboxyl-terminal processing protease
MVVGGAGAVLLGMAARDSADLGRPVSQDPFTGMLVASAGKGTPQDFDIPERPYFESMAQLLREDYVDPISDEGKLVSGAARGMILSLKDPSSIYMDKDEFRVFQSMRQGEYEGIGAELVYSYTKTTEEDLKNFPRLMVSVVAPGGPADKAGIKAGDIIESVNEHWIVDPETIIKFRKVARDVEKDKSKEPEFKKLRNELRKRSETSMMPARARDLLMIGTAGAIKASWISNGEIKKGDLMRQKTVMKPVNAEGGTIKLQMINGVATALSTALPTDGVATIDLRNNSSLDLALAREVLAVLAPAGEYGTMKSIKGSEPVKIADGQGKAKKLVLIVDQSTSGGAGIVARALASKGLAMLQGTPAKNLYAAEVVKLPKGDGFTLVRAEYFAPGAKEEPVKAKDSEGMMAEAAGQRGAK